MEADMQETFKSIETDSSSDSSDSTDVENEMGLSNLPMPTTVCNISPSKITFTALQSDFSAPCQDNSSSPSSLISAEQDVKCAETASASTLADEPEHIPSHSALYKKLEDYMMTVHYTVHEIVRHILFIFSLPRSGSTMNIFAADGDAVCLLWFILALLCVFLQLHFWRSMECLMFFRPIPVAMFMTLLRVIMLSVDELY